MQILPTKGAAEGPAEAGRHVPSAHARQDGPADLSADLSAEAFAEAEASAKAEAGRNVASAHVRHDGPVQAGRYVPGSNGHGGDVRVGDLVRVRRHRWRVADVRVYDHCQLVTLSGAGAPNAGAERRVIAPFDLIEPLNRPTKLRFVRPGRWRRACRALFAHHTPPGALRSPLQARMDLLPHQLEPAMALVRGLGSRLLLADAVGLGKTIQAALVVAELLARGAAERVLILTPAGLRDQWASELAERFDLRATVVDFRAVRRDVATLPVGVNPWSTSPMAMTPGPNATRRPKNTPRATPEKGSQRRRAT